MKIQEQLQEQLWQSYVLLLRFPLSIKMKYQKQLSDNRDALARALHRTSEEIQKKAEFYAKEQGGII